ncbi:hypothetical protein [Winogradskyella bathintestinalis]|uniref:Uncharacterized protein n=1 Tax=Winogradskyella bathintestinalis TaxID=3035208 RepID=A0ABT7ZZ13_9FLAO|nr:hypothetical protein [Winogradskyella bathintestinalis]MDN3494219.1 hypothetical protein [Winogradskyella bathintestinalis]
MDNIEKYVIEAINKKNNEPVADFEGYSPNEMQIILYNTFDSKSPIQILNANHNTYQNVPIFNQVKFLFNLINEQKELKLTNKGFLPTKIVAKLYGKGFLKDYFIENGISKLYKESDVPTINLAKILVELSTLVKKRNNKLTLTKKGIEQINNDNLLFRNIFETFTEKFNWSYFDGFSNEEIAQSGFGFTLILLDKYGKEYRNPEFYADKYLKAFDFKSKNPELEFADNPKRTYIIRTFERFLDYFGFTEYDKNEKNLKVKKTKIFNELIKIRTHNTV